MIEIIDQLARTEQFKPLCKKYAKRDWLTDELHQEFLLRLCELDPDKILEAKEGGYLDWFCFDVINKIWSKRGRVKCYENGNTNSLTELSSRNSSVDFTEWIDDINTNEAELSKAEKIIQKDIDSDDIYLNFRARIFTYSIGKTIENGVVKNGGKFKNSLQFAKATKIPYSAVYKAFVEYKKLIKMQIEL